MPRAPLNLRMYPADCVVANLADAKPRRIEPFNPADYNRNLRKSTSEDDGYVDFLDDIRAEDEVRERMDEPALWAPSVVKDIQQGYAMTMKMFMACLDELGVLEQFAMRETDKRTSILMVGGDENCDASIRKRVKSVELVSPTSELEDPFAFAKELSARVLRSYKRFETGVGDYDRAIAICAQIAKARYLVNELTSFVYIPQSRQHHEQVWKIGAATDKFIEREDYAKAA